MEPILEAKSLNLWYGQNHALHDVSVAIPERQITALYAEQNKLRTQRLALAPWLAPPIRLTAHIPQSCLALTDRP